MTQNFANTGHHGHNVAYFRIDNDHLNRRQGSETLLNLVDQEKST